VVKANKVKAKGKDSRVAKAKAARVRDKANKAAASRAAALKVVRAAAADVWVVVSATASAASSRKGFTSPTAAPALSSPVIWSATRKRK